MVTVNNYPLSQRRHNCTRPVTVPGGVPTPSPQQDPILSFLHTSSPKSAHVGQWHPQHGWRSPTGNPGSAIAVL